MLLLFLNPPETYRRRLPRVAGDARLQQRFLFSIPALRPGVSLNWGLNMSVAQSQDRPANRIALYLRTFSTDGRYAKMLETELREEIAAISRYRNVGSIDYVFNDEGQSLAPKGRPGLRALMDAVEARKVDLVWVPEFLDLAAYAPDLIELIQFLRRNGCGLRSRHEYLLFESRRPAADVNLSGHGTEEKIGVL